ncbi:MAG: YbhB/YbcL family Raf kinase inhibitor-like protein [candidate division Zixibacteria bacterium]|nr:YbhB/YbcL family Raf kinase inhibitor-like protein [candidate division Zixibacteria bacterium]
MEITSTAFKNGEKIPEIYACDFENISPPLNWGAGPEGTKSYVLICDDPDAPSGTFVHWVVYNIPAEVTSLPENIPDSETLDNGATHGSTHFGSLGYGGPCPPSGNPHRYYFKIYAVDFITAWKPGMSETKVMNRIEGHILLQGELMGTYQR